MFQEQGDGHRHQVERQLVSGCEALHDLPWRAKERRHVVDGLLLQISENVVTYVVLLLVHDVVQNNALASSVGAHLVRQVLARG